MHLEEFIHVGQGTEVDDISQWGREAPHGLASVTKHNDSRHVATRGVSPV